MLGTKAQMAEKPIPSSDGEKTKFLPNQSVAPTDLAANI